MEPIIYRGRKDDQPWVSYIYGKLHLARAAALAKVDLEAQWYEYERAIRRFREFPREDQPASVKAILMDVYLENGVAIQRSVTSLNWKTHGDVIELPPRQSGEDPEARPPRNAIPRSTAAAQARGNRSPRCGSAVVCRARSIRSIRRIRNHICKG